MHHRSTDPSDQSDRANRKRVGKACDRCRLKKSKCDGSKPCSRCRADNALCNYGERKRAPDKVHPKGYVELLERDREKLMNGLCALYDLACTGKSWPGPTLDRNRSGNPLAHDILDRLGVLNSDTGTPEPFDDDLTAMRDQLVRRESARTQMERQHSTSSSSDHSGPSSHTSSLGTPPQRQMPMSGAPAQAIPSHSIMGTSLALGPGGLSLMPQKEDFSYGPGAIAPKDLPLYMPSAPDWPPFIGLPDSTGSLAVDHAPSIFASWPCPNNDLPLVDPVLQPQSFVDMMEDTEMR